MSVRLERTVPTGQAISSERYTVPFFDTDAMGIVHHANYVRYLELGRVKFLLDHDQPYSRYIQAGFHVAVTRVEAAYHQACRFADTLEIVCWLAWVRSASLGFGYAIRRGEAVVVSARTDHAVVNHEGRPVRMPEPHRTALRALCGPGSEQPRSRAGSRSSLEPSRRPL